MHSDKKAKILFVQEKKSDLDTGTTALTQLFERVDMASSQEEAIQLLDSNTYDIVLGDITVDIEDISLIKQIKTKNTKQLIFVLVSPSETDKLYKIATFNIHAFELIAEQFDQALETIANFYANEPKS